MRHGFVPEKTYTNCIADRLKSITNAIKTEMQFKVIFPDLIKVADIVFFRRLMIKSETLTSFIRSYRRCQKPLDTAKAFDLASHSWLVARSGAYEMINSLLSWFSSYVSDRFQVVNGKHYFYSPARSTLSLFKSASPGPLYSCSELMACLQLPLEQTIYHDDNMYMPCFPGILFRKSHTNFCNAHL